MLFWAWGSLRAEEPTPFPTDWETWKRCAHKSGAEASPHRSLVSGPLGFAWTPTNLAVFCMQERTAGPPGLILWGQQEARWVLSQDGVALPAPGPSAPHPPGVRRGRAAPGSAGRRRTWPGCARTARWGCRRAALGTAGAAGAGGLY